MCEGNFAPLRLLKILKQELRCNLEYTEHERTYVQPSNWKPAKNGIRTKKEKQ